MAIVKVDCSISHAAAGVSTDDVDEVGDDGEGGSVGIFAACGEVPPLELCDSVCSVGSFFCFSFMSMVGEAGNVGSASCGC